MAGHHSDLITQKSANRRDVIKASMAMWLLPATSWANPDVLRMYMPPIPGTPEPPLSEFGFESTAEEVTRGLDLTGKTMLVTGCNSGLGLETMRVLALRGAHVIGAARTLEKAQAACSSVPGRTTPLEVELTDL